MRLVLDKFPLSPQSNNMYKNLRFGGRAKSNEYKRFERAVCSWADKREALIRDVKEKLKLEIEELRWIKVHTFFCLPHEMLFTKTAKAKDRVHKWDASNRIKGTHDALSSILDIDDRYFTVGDAEKVQTEEDPYTLIVLEPVRIVSDTHVIEEILGWAKSIDRSIL